MEFEAVSDELFGAKREEFTALRDERAKQARPDRELADRIAGLRKPTVAAWLVNQVSRACPEEIDELAELGEALRRAHQNLSGDELRSLSRRRHEAIDQLNKRAHWLARKAAYSFSDAAERQIADTFEAAVSDPQALEAVRAARLSTALTPGSPEQWLTAAIVPEAPKKKAAKKPNRTEKEREEEKRLRAERKKAQREADEAAEAEESTEQALRDAEHEADEAAARVEDLRARLDEAVQTEREKRAEVTAARKELTAAQRATREARQRAADLE